jgi:hypothetical protein
MSDNGYTDDTVQPRDGVFTSPLPEGVQPRDGVFTSSALEPAVQGAPAQFMPAQFTPALPGIPAEPLQPLQPAQFTPALPGIPAEPAQYMPEQFTPAIPAEPALLADGTPLEAGERIQAQPADGTLLEPGERIQAQPADGTVQPRDGVLTSSPLQPFQRAEAVPLGAAGTPETPRFQEPAEAEPRAFKSTGPDSQPAMLDREAAPPSGDNGDKPPSGSDNPPAGNDNPPSGSDNPPSGSDNPPSGTGSKGGPAVSVNTGKLAPIAPGLEGIMRNLYSIGNGTANDIGGYNLNKDSYGEAYTTTATPIASQILEGLANAGSVFGDAAEGASLTVHNYDVTEDNAIESANGLLTRSED